MARGWESKSVEQQQTDQLADKSASADRRHLTPAERQLNRQRESLELSRKRLAHQLEASTNPAHRQMIEQSLAEIDRRLGALTPEPGNSSGKPDESRH
jgi:molecular chaperone GrpE (heat shock protein)